MDFHTLQFATTVHIERGLFVEPFVGFGLVEDSADLTAGLNVPFHVPELLPLDEPWKAERRGEEPAIAVL